MLAKVRGRVRKITILHDNSKDMHGLILLYVFFPNISLRIENGQLRAGGSNKEKTKYFGIV